MLISNFLYFVCLRLSKEFSFAFVSIEEYFLYFFLEKN